jgi:hypothetical protein
VAFLRNSPVLEGVLDAFCQLEHSFSEIAFSLKLPIPVNRPDLCVRLS